MYPKRNTLSPAPGRQLGSVDLLRESFGEPTGVLDLLDDPVALVLVDDLLDVWEHVRLVWHDDEVRADSPDALVFLGC